MSLWLLFTLAAAWFLFALGARTLLNNPRAEPLAGLALVFIRLYARFFHALRVEGGEHVPRSLHPGPLILVCNHTAGVDPLLVQAAVPFEIRWMMARDMQPRALAALWDFTGVIPVNRSGADTTAARQALRYLTSGGVIGIFPEGGIERPPRTILPFQPGVGLLIHKSKAPVLQVVIDGTPATPTAWGSLITPSPRRPRIPHPPHPRQAAGGLAPAGARIRFLPILDFQSPGLQALRPADIADHLRNRLIEATGWPAASTRTPETQR